MGFAQATQKYLQGLHNVLRHFIHDKINTALPKHSFAGKKTMTDPEQKQTNNNKNNNTPPTQTYKKQNKNQKLVSYLALWKKDNMYWLGRNLVADKVI